MYTWEMSQHQPSHLTLPVLVINLRGSTERWKKSSTELSTAGLIFERLEAVDGRLFAEAELNKLTEWDWRIFFKPLSPGEIGCYLSHIEAAQRIVREGWSWALVFEDDFKLSPDFLTGLEKLLKKDLSSFDLIKIEGSTKGGETIGVIDGKFKIIRHRRPPSRTIAQLWSLEGAKKFLAKSQILQRPVDVQLKHWWDLDMNIVHISPPLVYDADGAASIIGQRKLKGLKAWIFRTYYKISFTLSSHYQYAKKWGLRSWLRTTFFY
jgi:glycosyl transferase family 25